jgi:hypothetical protein
VLASKVDRLCQLQYKETSMNLLKNSAVALALASTIAATAFAQNAQPTRIRGEVVSVSPTLLTVHSRSGDTLSIALKPDLAVSAVQNVELAAIKQGAFIGTATRSSPGGKLVALEVLVFPEAARGTGEGHYGWDLLPGSMMTNANVDTVLQGVDGRELTLSYKGGSKQVTVPAGVPIVTLIPATVADLQAGKKVFVVAQGEPGALSALRVVVEKDGVAPPM